MMMQVTPPRGEIVVVLDVLQRVVQCRIALTMGKFLLHWWDCNR